MPAAVMVWLYPQRSELLSVRPRAGWNVLASVLGLAVALVLLPEALDKLQLQFDAPAADEHAEFLHWGLTGVLVVQYTLAGLLAATNRPGSPALGVLSGLSLVVLGVGALVLEGEAEVVAVWSTGRALLAILAGVEFITLFALRGYFSLRRPQTPLREVIH